MIVKSLSADVELARFIDNAEKYGHKLDCVIVAHSHGLRREAADKLSERLPFFPVDIGDPRFCADEFHRRGVPSDAARTLLQCPVPLSDGLVPYGFNRNIVLMEAILRGVDVLFFVDSDVFPAVLALAPDGCAREQDADFFGAHLEHLRADAKVTTAEYSGYNILPPASFDGMEELLIGLQKADMLAYWLESPKHRSLMLQSEITAPEPCAKILGGNTGMHLSVFKVLPPFFSSFYSAGGETFLCRGEDTVLGAEIARSGIVCTDIRLNPLHDTYKDYPSEPDLKNDPAVQRRFYYACTGWVGRNPFMNHIRENDLNAVRRLQRENLGIGLRALAGYTGNPKYLSVMDNFDTSWENTGRYVSEYERVTDAWANFIKRSDLA
jgi:hypothetical protein